MFLPIHTDRPLRRKPVVNLALIAANVVVFMLQFRFPQMEAALLLRPSEPTLLAFFGSAFMHARQDLSHIGGNMLFLYIFGNTINDRLGNLAYLGFYLGGALTAGILHVLLQDAPVLGASGAVAAVTGAYLVLFPRSRIAVLIFFFVITVAYIPSLYLVGAFFLIDVLRALGTSFFGTQSAVASFAHLGGTFYGAGVGLLLMATNLVPRDQMDLLALLRRRRLRREHTAALRQTGQLHQRAHDIVPASSADPRVASIQDLRDRINAAVDDDDLRQAARRYVELLRLDPAQVLPMQRQLDLANQLAADRRHAEAAAAYELFLAHYPRHPDHARTQLMLGLIYARYLARPDDARRHLRAAAAGLADEAEIDIARRELFGLDAASVTD
jgi:membrane associated rhomboid family serine protease